jgi:hypothetical protein
MVGSFDAATHTTLRPSARANIADRREQECCKSGLVGQAVPAARQPLTGGAVNARHIETHWDELLRMATSIRAGTGSRSRCGRRGVSRARFSP